MAILWILINVMCTVNIRGHEANFYEAEARCHKAEIEAEARKSEAEGEASRPHGPCFLWLSFQPVSWFRTEEEKPNTTKANILRQNTKKSQK